MKQRNTVSALCIRNDLKSHEHKHSVIGNEKVKDLWQWAKGGENDSNKYIRLEDMSKAVKESLVMRNAYQSCLHSKDYKMSNEDDFSDQKLKSLVFLR